MSSLIWVDVGLGNWSWARDYLEDKKFRDPSIEWREGRGWLTRRFTIRGIPAAIAQIARDVAAIEVQLNKADQI